MARWSSLVVFLAAFAVYSATCARTVTLVDSGELILAASTLGVAHPPGFPLYTLVGFFFSKLPLGSMAFRLSLMSAFFAALTAALASLIAAAQPAGANGRSARPAKEKRGKKKRNKRKHEAEPAVAAPLPSHGAAAWSAALLPAACGLCLAFSLTLWAYATVAEVYSLTLVLLAGALLLLLHWRRQVGDDAAAPQPHRALTLAGLLLGLGLGVHHVTVVLFLPGVLVLLVATLGWRRLLSGPTLYAAAAGCAGLLVYLYLPLAAAREPLLNWGDPSTLQRFWWHVSAKQFRVYFLSGGLEGTLENLRIFALLLWRQLTPLGLVVAGCGAFRLWRRDRALLTALLLVAVLSVTYAVLYDIAEDGDAYYLTTFLGLMILLAAGLRQLGAWTAARPPLWGIALVVLTAGLPLLNLAAHWRINDRHDYDIARNYVQDALAGVAPHGLLMTRDWQLYAPFLYYHHLEGLRPDVTVVDINLVRRGWYVETYLDRVYPEMMAASARERDAYLAQLHRFEQGLPYDGATIQSRFTGLLDRFIDFHLPEREAHLTLPPEPGVGQGHTWVPFGLSFRLTRDRAPQLAPAPELHLGPLSVPAAELDEVARLKVRPTYALMLANRGRYLASHGRADEAHTLFDQAAALDPSLDLPAIPTAQ